MATIITFRSHERLTASHTEVMVCCYDVGEDGKITEGGTGKKGKNASVI
jgi:hypothetical protein